MKAWLLDQISGVDQLHLAETPDPVPGADDVVLAVRYAALNPADRYLAEGQYPAKPHFPHILGRDAIGEIVAVGSGISRELIGQIRMVLRGDTGVNRPGTFAQKVALAADSLIPVPSGWLPQESAGATLVYLTAYQALTQFGELPPSSVVLVTGASGGVGVASVQLGQAMGFTIVALSRSEEKRRELTKMGVALALDPGDSNWTKKLRAMLPGRRVDLAIDNIGGTLLPEVIETLSDQGRISIVGRLSGLVPQFNTASLIFRRIRIGGVHVGSYGAEAGRAAWEKVVNLMHKNDTRPLVDRVFPFDQLPAAFHRLKSGPMGKVVLSVGPSDRDGR